MRYLTIIPDYTGSCLQDDFEGQIDLEELGLPQEYITDLSFWHNEYKKIIPLSDDDRLKKIKDIERLDYEGLTFAKKLKSLVSGGAKVKYYSEGKQKYLHVD